MTSKISLAILIPIGFMLFSSFFGAGNVIFPPLFGYLAGSNLAIATLGFCITGVGLPLLGVIAIAMSGSDNINALGDPVHPWYSKCLLLLTALTIGPLFAIPRTGAVSYEIAMKPLLGFDPGWVGLAAFTCCFFVLSLYVAINPSKTVAWLGKVLTPMLLLCLAALFIAVFMGSSSQFIAPQGDYATAPFLKGFQEGYNTMDLLASFLFGAATINAIRLYGITEPKQVSKACLLAGLIAAFFLAVIYACLAYAGADSVSYITDKVTNGGTILVACTSRYLGSYGQMLLGLIILLACLTTSIGLIASISDYFGLISHGRYSYRAYAISIALFSFCASNIGLDNIISLAIPILCFLYPSLCALALLNIFSSCFDKSPLVYRCTMLLVTIFSIIEGLKAVKIVLPMESFLQATIPLYSAGFGWFTVGLVGAVVGYIWHRGESK